MSGRANKRRSPLVTATSSPTLIGAVTTLIVIVAVFLAYNANNGLPFVPVYRVSVVVPNAARLVPNNEIRIGGARVGVIESITAVRPEGGGPGDETGGVAAQLSLKLDKSASPIPENSIFRVRYRSTFGLKYLEITRGDGPPAPQGFIFNGTNDNDDPADSDSQILSIEETEENDNRDDGTFIAQTEFDAIGNTFDQPTRNAIRQNLLGYGDAFAARGASLNEAIATLNPLLSDLLPVARTLNNPDTRLARFFPALARTAAIVAPVAEQNAALFGDMAATFAAIGADPAALQATIAGGPPTLQAGIDTLPAQQPFLADVAELERRLNPGIEDLRISLPVLNDAIRVGTPALRRSVASSERLRGVFRALEDLVEQPTTKISLQRLGDLFDSADPLARYVVPAQTVCNYWNYLWTFLPEHLTERDPGGFMQRVSLVASPSGPITVDIDVDGPGPIPPAPTTQPGEVETGLSSGGYSGAQANGRSYSTGMFEPHELPILHANPGGPAGQDGQNCQPGQTGYLLGKLKVPGQSSANPAIIVPDLPGDPGVTDVYFNQGGSRSLRDTRVGARQP